MDNRTNVIAMMVLGAGIVALGTTIVSGEFFHSERPEKMGYTVEGVEAEAGGETAAVVPVAALLASADAAKGAEVFKKCAACHTIASGGPNGIGPNLYATVGEGIAEGKGGFAFSDALKTKAGGKWDFEALNTWLTSPRAYAPGTKMTFAGLSKPEDRANVIVYMNSQGSNLPLPAAPAPGAAPAKAPAGGTAGPAATPAAAPAAGKPGATGSGAPASGNSTAKPAPKG
ncbi:cytochrome c family protein [Sphingomonas sp.]|uniref:c-type cytochrome n=1 Tax=Sphingomonas sp. TaxID=28214 RepID=UPI0025E41788|nr:cytochrome c family protein [Sphingomonas sp.]